MSETKERSGIFKFFYVLLSIITFPIFAVLFILRHPIWVVVVLLLLAGGAAYWPMSQGVKLTEVVEWYQNKYQTTKFDLAKKAMEEGNSSYVPKAVLDEMRKIEEEAEEAKLPKGENYNAKVVRDKKSEDMKATMKKRGGFRKKAEEQSITESVKENDDNAEKTSQPSGAEVLVPNAGGLSAVLPIKIKKQEDTAPSITNENTQEVQKSAVDENNVLDLGFDTESDTSQDVVNEAAEQIEVEKTVAKEETSGDEKKDVSSSDEGDELDLF